MNPEDLLTDALHDRVERTDYPSTPLSTVAGRAGVIRARRRRTTTLVAAAAVAAVVVPGAVWLGRSPGSSPQPGLPASSGPTSSSTPAPAWLDTLPQGSKPGIDYLVGDTYVTMNGDRITSPVLSRADTATPVRGGILAAVPPSSAGPMRAGDAAVYLVTGGPAQSLGCGVDRFAMSTDGTESAYWLADTCGPGGAGKLYSGVNNTMGEAGPASLASPKFAVYEPIGILRQGTVVTVDQGLTRSVEIVDPTGASSPVASLDSAGGSDENNDVISGQLASGPHTGAVVDATDGSVLFRTPGWNLGQFSTDGKYVVGYKDGEDPPVTYAIFDAVTGAKLTEIHTPDAPGIEHVAWDTNDTLLAAVGGNGTDALVRFGLDGSASLASTPKTEVNGVEVYRLGTRP